MDIEQAKNIYATLIAVGWHPVPFITAAAAIIIIRKVFEPSVLDISTTDDKRVSGWIKLASIVIAMIVAILGQFGLTKPKDGYDKMVCYVMAVGDAFIGYTIYSLYDAIDPIARIKAYIDRKTGATPAEPKP